MEKYLYKDLDEREGVHFWHVSKRQTALAILKRFYGDKKIKILDLGCGTGANMKALGKFGEVWGVDVAVEAIGFCKKKGLTRVKLASTKKLPFKNEEFDLVTMFDVLEHVEEKETLKEVSRILKKDGSLLITVPAYSWLWSKWDEVLHHKRRYSALTLRTALMSEGFRVKFISYMNSYLLIPVVITRAVKSFKSVENYPSDFRLSTPLINKVLLLLARLERFFLLRTGVGMGTSVICLAAKK